MAFEWEEFLILAEELGHLDRESARRTAIGRAYYFCYHAALTEARRMGFSPVPPSLHSKLWRWCQSHSSSAIRELGITGSRMLALRHEADYYSGEIPALAGSTQRQLDRARQIRALLENLAA